MEKQVRKTFLPQDIAVLAAVFAAGVACLDGKVEDIDLQPGRYLYLNHM